MISESAIHLLRRNNRVGRSIPRQKTDMKFVVFCEVDMSFPFFVELRFLQLVVVTSDVNSMMLGYHDEYQLYKNIDSPESPLSLVVPLRSSCRDRHQWVPRRTLGCHIFKLIGISSLPYLMWQHLQANRNIFSPLPSPTQGGWGMEQGCQSRGKTVAWERRQK